MELITLTLASLLAGFVDAIVGGGGLILTPALFATFPQAMPATLFGTNKATSVWGTAMATWQYSRRVQIPWRRLWPGIVAALMGSFAGAWLVTQTSPEYLRKALPVVLMLVFIYSLVKKDLGHTHKPRFVGQHEVLAVGVVGLILGIYDGFFGPGTGSFLVFIFVRWLGYDFLNASACAKTLNVATNVAAVTLFAFKGHIWWHFVLAMAIANVLGSWFGSRLALKHGAGFVRWVFIVVVGALIVKTSYDGFLR